MLHLSHAPLFDCHNYIFPGVRIIEALHATFAASCYFIPVRSKYSKPLAFKNPQSVCVIPSVGDKFLHPYSTIGRIIVFCIGTCTFLDNRREGMMVLNRPEIDTLH
jgi:hypothetical protein